MQRSATSAMIQSAFGEYMFALREFFAVAERCAIKGRPARAATIRRHVEVQGLFRDQESTQLKYVLRCDSDVSVDSYTRVECLNANQFLSTEDARSRIEARRVDYNATQRPCDEETTGVLGSVRNRGRLPVVPTCTIP